MKGFGILCPIFSLPAKYGVGDFGAESYKFVDLLAKCKVDIWEVLPLNKTNKFNCPYDTCSTHTFDEMFVDLDALINLGLLHKGECKKCTSKQIDYTRAKQEKLRLFTLGYERADKALLLKAKTFAKKNKFVFDYAYFETLREVFGVEEWRKVDKKLWKNNSASAQDFIKKNQKIVQKYVFFQYILFQQWQKLKKYANLKGVKILGDLPIYCNKNSVEVFLNPQNFKLDKNFLPYVTGGCAPDCFSAAGQDWGTCIYNWQRLQKSKFDYFTDRVGLALKKYDYLRLDHFMGLVEHYENSHCQMPSRYVKEGGEALFKALEKRFALSRIVIEDLGNMTPECCRVRNKFNLQGMKILQYAFDGNKDNIYLPQNINKNSVYYLGNHDNNTFVGFLKEKTKKQRKEMAALLPSKSKTVKGLLFEACRTVANSGCKAVIFQIQDILGQGEKYRTNFPGRAADCWEYKLGKNYAAKFERNLKKIRFNA